MIAPLFLDNFQFCEGILGYYMWYKFEVHFV